MVAFGQGFFGQGFNLLAEILEGMGDVLSPSIDRVFLGSRVDMDIDGLHFLLLSDGLPVCRSARPLVQQFSSVDRPTG